MVIGIFKVGPPEDRGESSRFFRVGPREDRVGVLILLHTEISRNIIPTLALILLFPHTEISTRRYTLNEFKIISHRIHRIHRELLGKDLKESEQ